MNNPQGQPRRIEMAHTAAASAPGPPAADRRGRAIGLGTRDQRQSGQESESRKAARSLAHS